MNTSPYIDGIVEQVLEKRWLGEAGGYPQYDSVSVFAETVRLRDGRVVVGYSMTAFNDLGFTSLTPSLLRHRPALRIERCIAGDPPDRSHES